MRQRYLKQAIGLSIVLHIGIFLWLGGLIPHRSIQELSTILEIKLQEETPPDVPKDLVINTSQATDQPPKDRAYMDAPSAPTAEEWALASKYTLKNSKRYRHSWGQQVRSMMGRSVEGPDQGMVRFHIEISPNGQVSKVETIWSTSPVAEKLARQAIAKMPALPPTPNGKPLIFQQTISFQPFDTGWPPIYKYDCLPDPPSFKNPFAWDGRSAQNIERQKTIKPDTSATIDCPTDLMQDTIEAEAADAKRQFEQWGSSSLNKAK